MFAHTNQLVVRLDALQNPDSRRPRGGVNTAVRDAVEEMRASGRRSFRLREIRFLVDKRSPLSKSSILLNLRKLLAEGSVRRTGNGAYAIVPPDAFGDTSQLDLSTAASPFLIQVALGRLNYQFTLQELYHAIRDLGGTANEASIRVSLSELAREGLVIRRISQGVYQRCNQRGD